VAAVDLPSSVVVVAQEVVFKVSVAAEELSREWVDQLEPEDEEDNKEVMTTDNKVVLAVVVADVVLAGKTSTSHSETGMLQSTFDQTGRCSRRLTSTAWQSSTWKSVKVKT